jgi:hypothetical protein
MNDNTDDRLERLFNAARLADTSPSPREEGFEARLMVRLRERREASLPWYTWAWRFTPVFGVIIVALMVGSGMTYRAAGLDVAHAFTSGYENATLVSYLTGE